MLKLRLNIYFNALYIFKQIPNKPATPTMVTIIITNQYNIPVTNTFQYILIGISLPNPYNIPVTNPNTTETHTTVNSIISKSM